MQDDRDDSWMVELGTDKTHCKTTETTAGWYSWEMIDTLQDNSDDSWMVELGTDTNIARGRRRQLDSGVGDTYTHCKMTETTAGR